MRVGHLAVQTCSFSWVALACALQLSAGAAIRRALCGCEAQLTKPVFQRPALIRCSAGLQCRCASVRWPLAEPAAFAAADAAMPCHASLLQLSQQAPAGAAASCVARRARGLRRARALAWGQGPWPCLTQLGGRLPMGPACRPLG